ncbi:Membrane dipeptidase (Peptidase family M19) [Marinobacter litoralis]|uniref:Membrane dipeptidase (Peptidase family M19) n=1 Tax=Marinobacter litoralis TaxID=187981 RepID=A0A3M2RHV0_9GAMM|nr:dipeptidase [Marinobacter litoralis]RMJ04485.1 Membrane dipeptidase (Peptidase family M19) [Marinobacter litoralis]
MLTIDGLQYSNWSREIFEQMHAGGVSAVHATLVYHENTRETLSRFGDWNRRFEQHNDLIMPVYEVEDIRRAQESNRVGVFFGAQNCSPIEDDIDMIEVMRRLGLMIMQLTYNNQSLLAAGCYEAEDSGVSRFGRQAIAEMNRVGMIIDMSHSSERSTLDAIELSSRPVIISHANPASFHPAKRNKSDTVLKAIAESGGILGFSVYPFHLKDGPDCTLESFCNMVADTAELMGIDHIGIGTDLCQGQPQSVLDWMRNGRWSKEMDFGEGNKNNAGWPRPLSWFKDNRDFPAIIEGLRRKGFSEGEVEKIMGLNWLRQLEIGTRART